MILVRALVVFLLLNILSVFFAVGQSPFAEESASQADLREAVFRYMFLKYNYGPHVKVFCIEPERPLPEKFLRRFSENKMHVVWSTDCRPSGPMNGMQEKKSGDEGMLMRVIRILWINEGEAEVKVEAFSDGIAANWNTLRLVKKNRLWVIRSDMTEGVS